MTLSEIYYEAACLISDGDENYSCIAVDRAVSPDAAYSSERQEYSSLLASWVRRYGSSLWKGDVERAAKEAGWSRRDFRTFMLLMASEAVKP